MTSELSRERRRRELAARASFIKVRRTSAISRSAIEVIVAAEEGHTATLREIAQATSLTIAQVRKVLQFLQDEVGLLTYRPRQVPVLADLVPDIDDHLDRWEKEQGLDGVLRAREVQWAREREAYEETKRARGVARHD